MKLRILDNSIRIRIQQKELDALQRDGLVEATTVVGPTTDQQFTYRLRNTPSASPLSASLQGATLTIDIAPEEIDRLVNTDQVGVESENELAAGKSLHILVEKDFKCLTPRPGEEDAFPHPGEKTGAVC